MKRALKKFLTRLFDSDQRAMELHLFLGFWAVMVYLGLAIYSTVHRDGSFDMQSFGIGITGIFAGTGAAAWGTGLQRRAQCQGDNLNGNGNGNATPH